MVPPVSLVLVSLAVLSQPIPMASGASAAGAGSGELVVRLVDESGDVVGDDASFELVRMEDGRIAAWFVADEQRGERFAFTQLEAGRYRLEVKDEDEGFYVTGYADVVDGETTDLALSLVPRQPCVLSGRVVRGDTPVRGADIWAQRYVWPQPLSAVSRTNRDGRFRVVLPEPGEWLFQVRPDEWEISERGWNIAHPYRFSRAIQAEVEAPLEFELPEGSLSGTVLGPDDMPIRGYDVGLRAIDFRELGSRTLTDASGRFEFRGLAAGEYDIDVGRPDVFGERSYPDQHALQFRRVRVTSDARRAEGLVLALERGGELECEFIAHDLSPIAWEWVHARPASETAGDWFLLGRTGEDGRLWADGHPHVGGLPSGSLQISLRTDGSRSLATSLRASAMIAAGQRSKVCLRLEPATVLRIQAIDSSSSPVFVRLVELSDAEGRTLFIDGPESELRPLIATRPVPAGRYRVRVADQGGRTAEQEIELAGHSVQQLTFRF